MLNIPKTIKMIITDFDGIVTDNCLYVADDGSTTRKLNFKDIMGFSILKKNGYQIAIISGEANTAVDLIKNKFDIKDVYTNVRKKIDVLKQIIQKYNLNETEYLYIGDDINDLEALNYSKIKITVPNAHSTVLSIPNIQVTQNQGGNGAFREVADCLTTLQKKFLKQ